MAAEEAVASESEMDDDFGRSPNTKGDTYGQEDYDEEDSENFEREGQVEGLMYPPNHRSQSAKNRQGRASNR